jgi:hypothetical protein
MPLSDTVYDCGDELCAPASTLGTAFSLTPFLATFAIVFAVTAQRIFPHLARVNDSNDGEDHYLPASAPPALQAAHVAHGAKSLRRRIAAATFATTVALATVLAELILAEVSGLVSHSARALALRVTVPTLLFLLVVLIPFLELQSIVASSFGVPFRRTSRGRIPRMAWMLQLLAFGGWLFIFWSLGRAVPVSDEGDGIIIEKDGSRTFDSTAATIGRVAASGGSMAAQLMGGGGGLSRACLERIGVIGISMMALLSGFASISSPWQTFADRRAYRRRPVTDADIARKEAGLDAATEMLASKRHRLHSLQRKLAMMAEKEAAAGQARGMVGKMFGSLKGLAGSGGGEAAEIRSLELEISGLETMEMTLSSSLSNLRNRKAAHARDGTPIGRLLAVPSYAFSVYCIYRVLATTLTTLRRAYYPAASFSSSDPINRFLALIAKHWDPKLDQIAWARQISFLLSGVILAASANSALQTFRLFAKWTPGLLYQAQANLALLIGQISATFVISAAMLLRNSLPKEVGRSVGDALESALEPGFVDRWFEGWFLLASVATAIGIWVGRRIAGPGGIAEYDDWDDFAGEEMGQKRS